MKIPDKRLLKYIWKNSTTESNKQLHHSPGDLNARLSVLADIAEKYI